MRIRSSFIFALLLCATDVAAQRDTARVTSLDSVRVTAERASGSIGSAASTVTRISGEQLARTPYRSFADLLRLVPGFGIVDRDGMGDDAQPIVRGFYGGGEAEYVTLLIDGKPVSQLQSGVVSWDAMPPLASIEAIEVLRGNASSLWGDAAVGAVVNVITKGGVSPYFGSHVTTGSHTVSRAGIAGGGPLLGRATSLSVAHDRINGYRDHSARRSTRLSAAIDLVRGSRGGVRLSTRSHWRATEDPGPLFVTPTIDPRTSDPMFRFDRTDDDLHAVQVDADFMLAASRSLSMALFTEQRDMNTVRTIALAPGFGDTRERVTSSRRLWASVLFDAADTPIPWNDRLVIGADLSRGSLGSTWWAIFTGTADELPEFATRQSMDADGDATRTTTAAFAQYTLQATSRLALNVGARVDRIDDRYEPEAPDGAALTAAHTAWSPRAGLTFRYAEQAGHSGRVFANVTRSFKAPTLDQLFDQRPVPLPFPPYETTTSNALLSPQRGAGVEFGVDQLLSGATIGTVLLQASAYDTRMRDELDFDVQALRYANIARSRHRGLETSVRWTPDANAQLFATHAVQSIVIEHGEHAGNQLKAIPRQMATAGINVGRPGGLTAALLATVMSSVYLDDANSTSLPGHTRVDARLGYRLYSYDLFVDVLNVFDERYNSTGFLDPSGTGARYVQPAAGRMVLAGFRFDLTR